jgi:hypothetical protein
MRETVSEQTQLEKLRGSAGLPDTLPEIDAENPTNSVAKKNAGCRFLHQHPA